MVSKLVMLGVFVGCAVSLPMLYQANPERFHDMVRGTSVAEEPPVNVAKVAASQPASGARQLTGRRVEVALDRRGHFLAEFKLNGRRTEAMIDTGATLVALNRSAAARIGIKLSDADFRHQVNTANGTARAASARIDSLQIGRIHVEDVDAIVLEDTSLNDTLIGMSFLSRLGRFRIENGVLTLEQ